LFNKYGVFEYLQDGYWYTSYSKWPMAYEWYRWVFKS
jgi:hypothetical protein